MDQQSKVEFCLHVFGQIAASANSRLAYGMRDRERIKTALQNGEEVEGERLVWLQNTAQKMASVLKDCGQAYNENYPKDRISVMDMIDAIEVLLHWYKTSSER